MSEQTKVVVATPGQGRRFTPLAVAVYTVFTGAVVFFAGKILMPFITPILLALVIVTLSYGVFERMLARVGGRRNLAASLMLILVFLVLILPALLLTLLLIDQASNLFHALQDTDFAKVFATLRLEQRLAAFQGLVPWIDFEQMRVDQMMINLVRQIPGFVATQGTKLLAGFLGIFLGFIMMLLAAFVLYTEGPHFVREIKDLSPLPDEYDEQIIDRFQGVIDATFRGQLLTALAQGFVTAIGLAIAGVPGAVFWGAVAAVFSLIPMVGAAAVWIPADLYLIFLASQGMSPWWRAIFLGIWGIAVVSLVDNLVRPLAMRRGANMHPVLLFFAILGGLQVFGFTGLFLGPLVFALLVTVIEIYRAAFDVAPGSSPPVRMDPAEKLAPDVPGGTTA